MARGLNSMINKSAVRGLVLSLVALAVQFLSVSSAHAVSLLDATSQRLGFNFPKGDVSLSSYDGPAFDAFFPFASFVAPEVLKISEFTGQALGSQLDFTLLSESAAFDGTTNGFANKIGVVDSVGNFSTVIDSAGKGPGATGSIFQGVDQTLKLALTSPEGVFTTIDTSNVDGAAHILAMKVEKAGQYQINPTTLRDTPPLSFNFLEGDIILFIEDMLISGNLTSFLVPESSDFDYNDMVVVVRQTQTQVPEPSSLLLLSLAGLGAKRLRRRRQAA